jgi:hypothetical protein
MSQNTKYSFRQRDNENFSLESFCEAWLAFSKGLEKGQERIGGQLFQCMSRSVPAHFPERFRPDFRESRRAPKNFSMNLCCEN